MKSPLLCAALLALLLAHPGTVLADAHGNNGEREATAAAELPQRWQTMDQVRAQHGEPLDRRPAVGEPPISRWIYQGFTVYFEHQRVLHSVTHPH